MTETIDIVMATYNGELYIGEQLDSIIAQTYENWRLLISDDGSSDSTLEILKEYSINDSRITIVNVERQGGVIENFNKGLSYVQSNYIALADQDDIWPKDRLKILVTALCERSDCRKPKLVFSDLTLVDEGGNIITESFYRGNGFNPLENLKKNALLWKSTVYGCSIIMNRCLLDIALPIPKNALMHDQWLALKAIKYGELEFVDIPTVLYRQHSNNVVGGTKNGIFKKLYYFKANFLNIKKSVRNTKEYLKDEPGLYFYNRSFETKIDYMRFAFLEILPDLFKTKKKAQCFFIFVLFLVV